MVWPGDAVVHVSIVDWIKGDAPGMKRLFFQDGNKAGIGERVTEVPRIGPSLSLGADVTQARSLKVNREAGCYQGQTHGHKAFLTNAAEAKAMLWKDKTGELAEVLHPYLIANELVGKRQPKPQRYVIDFHGLSVLEAKEFSEIFERIKKNVLTAREKAAKKEAERNQKVLEKDPKATVNRHHENFLKSWWQLSYGREEMIIALEKLSRYIVCGQVTKRPIFAFVNTKVRPNAALQVFAYEDDYTFGILQSDTHWRWFTARCSTMKSDPRYTSNTVWDSFPWPQVPTQTAVKLVAEKAVWLRTTRDQLALKHNLSLRDLYRLVGTSRQESSEGRPVCSIDRAVRAAYGMDGRSRHPWVSPRPEWSAGSG